jgi:MFS family permease
MAGLIQAGALEALHQPDFRRYWLGFTLSRLGQAMQTMAVAWQVYLITHEPFSLGLIGLVQVGPVMLFSLLGGAWADTMSRRRLLIGCQAGLMLMSATLTALAASGVAQVSLLYAILFVSAILSSAGGGAQAAIIPSLVPRHLLTPAISLKNLSWSVAGILGPAIGGLVIAHAGLTAVYAFDTVSFLALIAGIALAQADLDAVESPAVRTGLWGNVVAIREGFAFLKTEPVLLHLIVLDFFAVIFGEARTMLPVFASDVLGVGAAGLGILSGATAVGAAIGAAAMAAVRPPRWPGRVVLISIGVYGLCTAVFGLSPWFWLSWAALVGAGIADTISMTQRQVIPQLLTTESMRGRVGGINLFFAATGNQVGEFEAGTVAHWLGARMALLSGGLACIGLAAAVTLKDRSIWKFEVPPHSRVTAIEP